MQPFQVEVFLQLSSSVFRQGETITAQAEVTLEKGNASVEGLSVLLVQVFRQKKVCKI